MGDRLEAAVEPARKQVKVAQANLEVVRGGAKTGAIGAQQATSSRLKAKSEGQKDALQTTVDRLKTQRDETQKAQDAIVKRLEAELRTAQEAQDAIARRLKAELRSAQTDFERYRQLANNGAIPASELDNRRLKLATAIENLSILKVMQ